MNTNIANIPAAIANVAIETPVNDGRRNNDRSNIGRGWRRSSATKAAINSAAPANEATIRALDQPSVLARRRPKMSRNSAPEKLTTPAMSTGPAFGSRDSPSRVAASATVSAPIGT